jgi:ABC-type proline/glycine betaine transport system substrate-binding protein
MQREDIMRGNPRSWIVGAGLLALAGAAGTGPAVAGVPESSDPIKLAINEWTGQVTTTHIAGEILKRMAATCRSSRRSRTAR